MSLAAWKKFREELRNQLDSTAILPSEFQPPQFSPSCQRVEQWWASDAKIKLLVGANQSGKSETAGAYVSDFMRNNPNTLIWAVATTFEMSKICYDKITKYLHPSEIEGVNWAAKGKGIAHSLRHINGSEVVFKSCDSGFRKFEGAQVNLIWADEEIKDKPVYTSCVARTTMTQGQIILSMTPLMGKTWIYHELFKSPSPQIFATTITLYDNIYLPDDQREQLIALYSEDERRYRVYGKWGQLTGRIYRKFSDRTHVIPFSRSIIERCRTIIRGLDFGRNKACIWIGLDDNDVAYVLAEWKQQEVTLREMAEEMKRIEKDVLCRNSDDTVSDHAFQERFELENFDVYCEPAKKTLQLGFEIVRRRLELDKLTGTPALLVCDSCVKVIDEMENYVSKGDNSFVPKSGQDDHLVDTLRYAVVKAEEYSQKKFGEIPKIKTVF